jgi:hypothetical protein
MRDPRDAELPSVADAVAPILAATPPAERPLLIALAERTAAQRYRDWAEVPDYAARRAELLACADREEEIARRVEAHFPEAAAVQRDLTAKHPDLDAIYRSFFGDRPLAQQFAIQAQGERLGAATWRSFAKSEPDAGIRATFLACAELEEASAVVLESIAGGG